MTDDNSRIARLEERANSLESWRTMCEDVPRVMAELYQWKRDQNGFMKDLRDDFREVKTDVAELKKQYQQRHGVELAAKFIIGVAGIGGIVWIVESIVRAAIG